MALKVVHIEQMAQQQPNIINMVQKKKPIKNKVIKQPNIIDTAQKQQLIKNLAQLR